MSGLTRRIRRNVWSKETGMPPKLYGWHKRNSVVGRAVQDGVRSLRETHYRVASMSRRTGMSKAAGSALLAALAKS